MIMLPSATHEHFRPTTCVTLVDCRAFHGKAWP